MIKDNFRFRSQFDAPNLRIYLEQHLATEPGTLEPKDYGVALARAIAKTRPELDVYLLLDRAVEKMASHLDSKNIRRIFYGIEDLMEIHLAMMEGVNQRYDTPYFNNLKNYARRPVGTFHALPIARGKSVFNSHWIRDFGHFYGANIFMAESSATTGGLDSLLEPTGNIKVAQEKAARAFGCRQLFFGTNGTSTSNKIAVQTIVRPGDIVLVDRNCHKSHHYGLVLGGGQPLYVEAYPLTEYSMYGAVPLRTIKKTLFDLKAEGKLDRVRMLLLTNCTFDGHVYNVQRFMEEVLAIKPDIVFLWDEAWYAYSRFTPFHRMRSAMGACEALREKYASDAYRAQYAEFKKKHGKTRSEKSQASRHAPAARPGCGQDASLCDNFDAQVALVLPPGFLHHGKRRLLGEHRANLQRGLLCPHQYVSELATYRFARHRPPPGGARRL